MATEDLIPLELFCESHSVEISFIRSLHDLGLIEITLREEHTFIPADQLRSLERILRLQEELGINVEGIDAIGHLLVRVEGMQAEITALKNRLRRYGELE